MSNCQGVSKAILDKAGPIVEAECLLLGKKHLLFNNFVIVK